MRIIQINTVCSYGSTGRIVVELNSIIKESGNEGIIAYGREIGNCNIPDSFMVGNEMDHKIHGLGSRIFDRQGFFSKKATIELINKIKDYKPDIIHLHNIHGYYINIKRLFDALYSMKIPVVWTFHDCWPFTGHCTYFDSVNCNKWKKQCENCPQKKEYPKSLILDQSKKNYRDKKEIFTKIDKMYIVSPSKWLNKLVGESFLRNYNHRVINNGIDLDTFVPTLSDFREKNKLIGKIILLGVASIWGTRKGYQDFLKLSRIIDENMAIVMVGINKEQRNDLPSNIIGIERTNNVKELSEIYSASDYFLNLTYQDNFPTTNIEALACGTPVITYNTGGSVECINDKCGGIVEKGDYAAIPKFIKNHSFNSSDCVKRAKMYSKKNKYLEYLELYREVLLCEDKKK